jgi:hypothetical protein
MSDIKRDDPPPGAATETRSVQCPRCYGEAVLREITIAPDGEIWRIVDCETCDRAIITKGETSIIPS